MPFLKLRDPDVSWIERTIQWRQWNTETALMTTNCVDFIEPQEFVQQVLEESAETYICYFIMVEDDPPYVHPFRIAQISTTTSGNYFW